MQHVAFLIYPDFQLMGLAAATVFEFANIEVAEPLYAISYVSEAGGPIGTSLGMSLETKPYGEGGFDTLIVCGANGVPAPTAALRDFVGASLGTTRRLAAICTGAYVLAAAGILDGRRATTHWGFAPDLQARYPGIKMDPDRIFVVDGSVWTSAGMTAGIDLALAMVEKDLGADVARAVSKNLVVHHRRAGGQSQFSALLNLDAKSDRIQSALAYARDNLHTPLTVEQLADAAHLSPRQFSRAFRAETGQSPAKAIENLRVEAARLMMEQGRHGIDVVARETGFADRERMRRSFLRAFGQPPQVIRRNAQREFAA
jgi:transcriptional regulator GlxA family with amidase domain